jgi:hypothetical protein
MEQDKMKKGLLFSALSMLILSSSLFALNGNRLNHLIAQGVPKKPLQNALKALNWAEQHNHLTPRHYAIVDFSQAATSKRMYIIDLKTNKLIYQGYCTHGQKSGGYSYPVRFSNHNGSHQSSLGLFEVAKPYYGQHGLSLRLDGLEKGINDEARSRAIVIHSAPYVNDHFVKTTGRLGRSWGCFVVNPHHIYEVKNDLPPGSLLFSYAKAEQHDPYFGK